MAKANSTGKFGTAPVFITAISTILGAILFLRFGYATGTLGFWGVILIILLGHLVTIPTALAISEIATNKRVEGGGEYFIISRSFGLNIGATIGIALFLSQAISMAFYVIAFTEAFEFFFHRINPWWNEHFSSDAPKQIISIPMMLLLSALVLKKGANVGVKALYFVVFILFVSLLLFFLGGTPLSGEEAFSIGTEKLRNMNQFFIVFAIIFPAFTGITAGVGLSGDLKNPSKSIPLGTTLATFAGMIIYVFVVYKLSNCATPDQLLTRQLVMADIAIGGAVIIPLGLAASTISSALGSVMVAPRTLQAIAKDNSFPIGKINRWLGRGRSTDNEPINASIITCIIAMAFVLVGDVNGVAKIISMFFMVTYGALSLISFLNHFGASPSYRPSFKSKWYISLIGFITSVWVMFKIDTPYAFLALLVMLLLYAFINYYHKSRSGFEGIYANAIYQLSRNLQVFVQKHRNKRKNQEWRPSVICISKYTMDWGRALRLLDWISYKFGFGTYLHHINGYYSKATVKESEVVRDQIINERLDKNSQVFVDTIISPSNTSAIAQAIQIPGIAGMENNMVLFEFNKDEEETLQEVIENIPLVAAGNFDIGVLANSSKPIICKQGIHLYIRSIDTENANLLILLSFVILGHPDWKKADVKIIDIAKADEMQKAKERMRELLDTGRLPITEKNIEIVPVDDDTSPKTVMNKYSAHAGLVLIGFREESLKHDGAKVFEGFEELGDILFVFSHNQKSME